MVKNNICSISDSDFFNDKTLSWKAKGLLFYLLNKPDDWKTTRSNLLKQSKDGGTSINSGILELMRAGYITKEITRDVDKRIISEEFIVSDTKAGL